MNNLLITSKKTLIRANWGLERDDSTLNEVALSDSGGREQMSESNLYKKEILHLLELLRTLRHQLNFLNLMTIDKSDYKKICNALNATTSEIDKFTRRGK